MKRESRLRKAAREINAPRNVWRYNSDLGGWVYSGEIAQDQSLEDSSTVRYLSWTDHNAILDDGNIRIYPVTES